MNDAPLIGLVDYGMGNRRSVHKALEHVGANVVISDDPAVLRGADGLVVPGVGAFPQGMANLAERGLDEEIRAAVADGRPVLGICLGMQLLFERSHEHETTAGLALIGGEVRRLRAPGLRIPHIGWTEVTPVRPSPLTGELPPGGRPFYHVHSLVAVPDDPDDVIATAVYGERFATVVGRGRVHGVQFHPEKSSADGLALLRGFARWCAGAGPAVAPAGSASA